MILRCLLIPTLLLFVSGAAAGEESKKGNPCPKTTMTSDCLKCHIASSFKLKETPPDAHLSYPGKGMKIQGWAARLKGFYLLKEIDADGVKDFFDYLDQHKIKEAVVEIHSPGGSLFDAQRIVNLFDQWRAKGGSIETQCLGLAASAGFYIFVSGDKGKRFVSRHADLMWHEIRTIEGWGLRLATPATKEDEARVFRHLQNTRNEYLATRGKLSKEKLDEMIKYKDWWLSGKQVLDAGFADGYLGEP